MTRTGQTSRWSSIKRSLISAVPRRWPQPFLKCRAPSAADRSRDETGKSPPPGPGRNARSTRYRVPRRLRIPPSASIAPVAQHRGGNAQLACDPAQQPTAAHQPGCHFPLELIRKMTPSPAHTTPFRSRRSLAKVSTNSREPQDQYDPPSRTLAAWHPPDRQAAARPLADIDLSGGIALRPCVIDGPINGTSFRACVEQFLVPPSAPATSSSRTTSAAIRPSDSPTDPQGRRQAVLPAALLARPQPDRAGLRQAQDPAAENRSAHHRGQLARHRLTPRPLQTRGMRQLPRQRRLCFSLTGSCSRQIDLLSRPKHSALPRLHIG